MPRKEATNHGARCKPLGGAACDNALNGSGKPAHVCRACPVCAEKGRCSAHCKCGRNGLSRSKAKKKATKAKAAAPQRRPQPPVRGSVVLPVRAAVPEPVGVEVFRGLSWWDSALTEVAAAKKKVSLFSLLHDNTRMQTKLLAARARGVAVEVVVDRVSLERKVAPKAGGRLQKLKEAGAKVHLASGKPYEKVFGRKGFPGDYHAKVLVVDGAVSYCGGANSTNQSLVNGEVVLKVTGAKTAGELYQAAWAEAEGVSLLKAEGL